MNESPHIFEMSALKRVEDVYRARLASDPGDMVARINLAWCLLMQVLHQAGQESMLSQLVSGTDGLDEQLLGLVRTTLDRDIGRVLADCLRQSYMVLQLSPDPHDRRDVVRLQELVRMSGGEAAVSEAEDGAMGIITRLTHAILHGVEGAPANSGQRS